MNKQGGQWKNREWQGVGSDNEVLCGERSYQNGRDDEDDWTIVGLTRARAKQSEHRCIAWRNSDRLVTCFEGLVHVFYGCNYREPLVY